MTNTALGIDRYIAIRTGFSYRRELTLAIAMSMVCTAVALVLAGFYSGTIERSDRTHWSSPSESVAGHEKALQVTSTQFYRDRPITVVELAHIPGAEPIDTPPGLTTFPEPDHTYASPALIALMDLAPSAELRGRFPDGAVGTIGPEALASPDELIAVVGRRSTDPRMTETFRDGGVSNALPSRVLISDFSGHEDRPLVAGDSELVLLAITLMVVSVLVLATTASRLGTARRERRTASLRLVGATRIQVARITAIEAAAAAATGAIAGVLFYAAAMPALASWKFGVGRWYVADLWPGTPLVLAVVATVVVLSTASAVAALHQAAISPLAVAGRANARSTSSVRVVVFLSILAAAWIFTKMVRTGLTAQLVLILAVYVALWTLGPWVTDVTGRLLARFARGPVMLIAARRLSDDPRGSWRTTSGLVMAGFIVGFFAFVQVDFTTPDNPRPVIAVSSDTAQLETVHDLLANGSVSATARQAAPDDSVAAMTGTNIAVHVDGEPAQMDKATTILTAADTSIFFVDSRVLTVADSAYIDKLRAIGTAVLVLGFIVAAVSAGSTAASDILIHRQMYSRLHSMGTPMKVLNRTRIAQTAVPLVLLMGTTISIGALAALRVNSIAGTVVDTRAISELALSILTGVGVLLTVLWASTPLLIAVTEQNTRNLDS